MISEDIHLSKLLFWYLKPLLFFFFFFPGEVCPSWDIYLHDKGTGRGCSLLTYLAFSERLVMANKPPRAAACAWRGLG